MRKMTPAIFFGEFHEGVINRIFHLAGFILFIVAVWNLHVGLMLVSLVIQESGHIYHELIEPKNRPRLKLTEVLLWQVVVGGIVLTILALIVLMVKQFT